MNFLGFDSIQKQFEQRFNCAVCWCAKLRMVSGLCQHRFCEDCLYNQDGSISSGFQRCPTCQQENVFPPSRPSIPEDNIEIQKQLGVFVCPNKGCSQEMWTWEYEQHENVCPKKAQSKTPEKTPKVTRILRSSSKSLDNVLQHSSIQSTPSPTRRTLRHRPYSRANKQDQNARRSLRTGDISFGR